MNFRNSVISISLASLLVGCGGDNDSVKNAINGPDIKGSTMLKSELIYNQVVASKTKESVLPYIMGKFGGAKPTEQNSKDIETAVANAKAAHPDKKPAAVTAAVINKVIAIASSNPSGIKDITVTAQDIVDADVPSLAKLEITTVLDKNVTAEIDQQITDGWADSKDASIRYITAKNGKVVGGSVYHNALTVMDANSQTVVYTAVGAITDHGHHADSVSGASEGYVRGVHLNENASYVYVNIKPGRGDSQGTTGLYKAKIKADGSIATITTELDPGDGKKIDIDTSGDSYKLDKNVQKFAVSSDDSRVAVYDEEKNLYVYSGDLTTEISAVETDGLDAIAISTDTVFAAVDKNITKMLITDLSNSGQIASLDFKPSGIILNSDASKLIAYDSKTKIAVVNLADGTINSGTVTFHSSTVSASDDFSKVVLAGREEKNMLVVNLTVPGFSIQGKYPLEEGSRGASFIDNNKIAVINNRNGMAIVNIATTTDNINLDYKILSAKETLNKATMNGGGYFNAVIKDMTLSKAYENLGISWSSTLPVGNLNPADGNVTRPANNAQDVSGKLTALISASFRGDKKEGSKEFDISIRKSPAMLAVPKIVETGRAQYMAANMSGSVLVAPIQDKFTINGQEEDKYGLASYLIDSNGDISIATAPKMYASDEQVVGVGVNGNSAFALTAKESSGRLFSVAIASNGTLSSSVISSVDIATGVPQKVEWNADNSKAVVMVKEADETFLAEIYNVDADGNIALDSTIDMGENKGYKTYGPPAINEAGDKVFQRDGEKVYAIDSNGVVASAEVEEIARVWYIHDRVIVNSYDGNIFSFNEDLGDLKIFSTGTGGRMYGAEGRIVDGEKKLFIPVQRSDKSLNGIYVLGVADDGTLTEELFSNQAEGADRMAVSGNGKRVFFGFRDSSKKRQMAVVTIP